MGTGASVSVNNSDLEELQDSTHFTAKEISKLLKRYSRYDQDDRQGMSMKDFLSIPEISTNPIMPKVAMLFLGADTHRMNATSFVKALSFLSPRNSLDEKRKFAFQVLDTDADDFLSFDELYSAVRMLTGPSLPESYVISIVASVLNRDSLEQKGRLAFEEFCQIVSDQEIEELFTLELQMP